MKKAFSLIELVFVIVVLGIVASIGSDIISSMYKNYIKTRTSTSLLAQTELVLDQIENRLKERIPTTEVARIGDTGAPLRLGAGGINETYNVLEWYGNANEAFKGVSLDNPGYSGVVDIRSSSRGSVPNSANLVTSGTRFDTATNILRSLAYGTLRSNRQALLFKTGSSYNVNTLGYNGTSTNDVVKVWQRSNTDFNIEDPTIPTRIYELYYLSDSGYAIVPQTTGTYPNGVSRNANNFDLILRYNYHPWQGQRSNVRTANNAILAQHVSLFRFSKIGGIIWVKLCLRDPRVEGFGATTGTETLDTVCKTRAIL